MTGSRHNRNGDRLYDIRLTGHSDMSVTMNTYTLLALWFSCTFFHAEMVYFSGARKGPGLVFCFFEIPDYDRSGFAGMAPVEVYPTKEEKGARLGYTLISNHAFADGNKRIGVYIPQIG